MGDKLTHRKLVVIQNMRVLLQAIKLNKAIVTTRNLTTSQIRLVSKHVRHVCNDWLVKIDNSVNTPYTLTV